MLGYGCSNSGLSRNEFRPQLQLGILHHIDLEKSQSGIGRIPHGDSLLSAAGRLSDRASSELPYRTHTTLGDRILRFAAIGRYAWYCLIFSHARKSLVVVKDRA